jgi:hypothetical protein
MIHMSVSQGQEQYLRGSLSSRFIYLALQPLSRYSVIIVKRRRVACRKQYHHGVVQLGREISGRTPHCCGGLVPKISAVNPSATHMGSGDVATICSHAPLLPDLTQRDSLVLGSVLCLHCTAVLHIQQPYRRVVFFLVITASVGLTWAGRDSLVALDASLTTSTR